MAFHPALNCAEITLNAVLDSQECVTTAYAQFPSAYVDTDIQALADDVDAWVGSDLLPAMGSNWNYLFTHVRGLTSPVDLEADAFASVGNGALSGNNYPNNVAWAISRRTGHTGRAARGRVFVPGLNDNMTVDPNHMAVTPAANLVTAWNALRAAILVDTWIEVVLHRISGGVFLSTAVIYPVTEYIFSDAVLDSQRRRLPGRGA